MLSMASLLTPAQPTLNERGRSLCLCLDALVQAARADPRLNAGVQIIVAALEQQLQQSLR